jgi:thiamine-phosphate pyrophosphorylase
MNLIHLPRLHLVTDDRVLSAPEFPKRVEAALEGARRGWGGRGGAIAGGVGSQVALHLRGPATSGRRLWEIGRAILPLCREAAVPVLVNDRLDLALVLGAEGAHLGERSLPPVVARGVLGADALLGFSVHGPDGVASAAGAVDFLFVGSAYATRTHPGRPPIGLEGVRRSVTAANVPVLAIGGVEGGRIPELLRAGAYGVALIGAVWDSTDPGGAVTSLLDRIGDSLQSSGAGGQKG